MIITNKSCCHCSRHDNCLPHVVILIVADDDENDDVVWCGVVWFKAFHASHLPPRGKTTRKVGIHVIFVVLLVWHCSITVVIVFLSIGHNIVVDEGW